MKRLLLVEDHPDIADNIREYLGLCGYSVEHARTLKQALILRESHTYDLAILDIGLPDGDGFELAKLLSRYSDTPFLFLTARSAIEDRLHGFDLGAIDYIVKPFDLRELEARIRSRISPKSSKIYKIADMSLDFDQQIFGIGQASIHLTQKEQQILLLLLERDRVVSRSELIEELWGE